MAKRFRSTSSGEELLAAAAATISDNQGRSSIKTLIWSLSSSSPLVPALPHAIHVAVSRSLDAFKSPINGDGPSSSAAPRGGSPATSRSPPTKRSRRSSRRGAEAPQTLDRLKELRAFACVAQMCLEHPKGLFSPSDLLPAVRSLHDGLVLYESDPALLSLVARICEEWWKERRLGREELISQSLPFFLAKSLTQARKGDVRRVYALREAFSLFDYEDESIEDVRLLLVRCAITPVYLKMEEGRKFIACVLGFSHQLMKDVLELIRSQIPLGRKSVVDAYADIVFRAWKDSEGLLQKEVEDHFLQGLIEGAIHASSRPLAASARRVMSKFVEQKVVEGVDKLLFRLAEPVLFRSLQVANSNVRLNALHMFLDMFPLQDPLVTKEEKDQLLDKQFFLLETLILDDCPDVRAAAVEGSCRILNLFWEVIPSSTITNILTKLIDQMSNDICNEVRVSTVNGIIYLLDNPQSHDVMKVLLPRFGRLFSDRVLSVRIAVTDLLLAVRDVSAFQFHKVVGLDALLSSLANDHPSVAQRITRLLIPSYFPSKVNLKEACGRFIALIKRSSVAGARFCEFALLEGSSVKSLVELVHVCTSLVLSSKNLTPDQIDGLLIASSNICHTLKDENSCKGALLKLLSSGKLKNLLSAAVSPLSQAAVLRMALVQSPDELTGIHEQCMAVLANGTELSEDVVKQAVIRAAHTVIRSCGRFDELFEFLTNELHGIASSFIIKFGLEMPQQTFGPMMKKNANKVPKKGSLASKSSRRSALSTSDVEKRFALAAGIGWQMNDLLTDVEVRKSLLKSPMLDKAISALNIISQVCIEHFMHQESMDTTTVTTYAAICMFLYIQNVEESSTSKTSSSDLDDLICEGPSTNKAILDQLMSHLLSCSSKMFHNTTNKTSGGGESSGPRDEYTVKHLKSTRKGSISRQPIMDKEKENDFPSLLHEQNVVKMASSILILIVDAASIGAASKYLVQCLTFSSTYVKHVLHFGRMIQHKKNFRKDDMQDMMTHLKSSVTYVAKLLHLVLSGSGASLALPIEVFQLATDLLDLLSSLELYFSSSGTFLVFCAVKTWVPTMLLGLCSYKQAKEGHESGLAGLLGPNIPMWLSVLAKVGLSEDRGIGEVVGDDQIPPKVVPLFTKLAKTLVVSLRKGKPEILSMVGCVILAGVRVGMRRDDYHSVLGLVYFLSADLLGSEFVSREAADELFCALREIYSEIEVKLLEPCSSADEGKPMLRRARTILGGVVHRS